ncbi:MAG: ABC transporter substrate-binding protein [Pelagibacterales bacterium]|nr:ABC transporter substrate-binding protein [Pelagibacterales bacterium]
MKRFTYIIALFFLLSPALIAKESADTFVRKTVEEISTFISENKSMLENDEKYLRTKVDELVIPKLNISLMSKIVLGRDNWTSSNDYQKREFQKAFRSLMVRTYMKSLTTFDGERMKFLPFKIGKKPNIARVNSVYLLSDGELPVSYRLKFTESDGWKVFDIIIDGISLLKNYRTDFQEHIQSNGINSLIAELNGDG